MKIAINKKQVIVLAAAAGAVSIAMATTSTDTDFQAIVTLLKNWSTGTLGKTVALGMFVVGLAAGIMRQSIMAAVAGVGGAMAMSYGPGIIENIFGALI